MWGNQFSYENRKYTLSMLFLLSESSKFHDISMWAQYKTLITLLQSYFGYSVKNMLETVYFNLFSKRKTLSGRLQISQISYSDTSFSFTYCINGHAKNQLQKEYLNFIYAHWNEMSFFFSKTSFEIQRYTHLTLFQRQTEWQNPKY